jgi:hypothetical protein
VHPRRTSRPDVRGGRRGRGRRRQPPQIPVGHDDEGARGGVRDQFGRRGRPERR